MLKRSQEEKMTGLSQSEIISELEKLGITSPHEQSLYLGEYYQYFSYAFYIAE